MGYTLTPLTETSWILQQDGIRIALVSQNDSELTVIGKLPQNKFSSIKDLEKFLGAKIKIEELIKEEEVEELELVNGYPVKHTGVTIVDSDDLPIYLRSANSNTQYAAGYYGVQFPNGWVTSYCPKLTTLLENEYLGPFKTKLEMQNSITQKKRQIDI